LTSLGHPSKFQRLSRLRSVTARHPSSGRQPNFAALNRVRHLCSAEWPSRWALAHILVTYISDSSNVLWLIQVTAFSRDTCLCISVASCEALGHMPPQSGNNLLVCMRGLDRLLFVLSVCGSVTEIDELWQQIFRRGVTRRGQNVAAS